MNSKAEIDSIIEKGTIIIRQFEKFSNKTVDLDSLENLFKRLDKLYNEIHVYYRVNNSSSFDFFYKIYSELGNFFCLKNIQKFSKKAMIEYNLLDKKNEENLLDWILKYENDSEIYFDDYGDNYSLIYNLINTNENITIDISKYKDSYDFNLNYWNHWYDIYFKYIPKDSELKKIKNHTLTEYLIFNNMHIEILGKYNKI